MPKELLFILIIFINIYHVKNWNRKFQTLLKITLMSPLQVNINDISFMKKILKQKQFGTGFVLCFCNSLVSRVIGNSKILTCSSALNMLWYNMSRGLCKIYCKIYCILMKEVEWKRQMNTLCYCKNNFNIADVFESNLGTPKRL